MTVTAVLFDLDGTLLDHRSSAIGGLRAWCESLGCALTQDLVDAWFASETVHYQAWLDGVVSHAEQRRRRLRDFLPLLGLPVPDDAELDVLYAEGFLAGYEAAWHGYEDAASTLSGLRAAGLRTGVLTNGAAVQQTAKIRALGVEALLDVVVTSEEIGCAKPDPRAFRTACRRLGVEPGRTVYVGDNYVVDVLGARSAGLGAVHVDRAGDEGPRAEQRISSLGQLPEYLADRFRPGSGHLDPPRSGDVGSG